MDLEMYGIKPTTAKDNEARINWIVEKPALTPLIGVFLGEGDAPTSKGGTCPVWIYDISGSPFVLLRMQKFKQDMKDINEGDKVNIFMNTQGVLSIKKVN